MLRAVAVVLVVLAACGDNRAAVDAASGAPAFRHPVSLPDDALSLQALQILGAGVPDAQPTSCNACHGLTRQRLRYWGLLSDTSLATCLTDLPVSSPASARTMIDCLRAMPLLPASDFQAQRLGVFASAARLPWFQYAFETAYGADAPAQLAAFQALAGMPREEVVALTQEQFDIVAEWFIRGLPALEVTLAEPPPPDTCTQNISPAVATHVAAMATQGWAALDAQAGLAMQTLTAYPERTEWEAQGHVLVVADEDYRTSYWTRSSPDGRFVAHGVEQVAGSYIIDLQRGVTIPVDAMNDPAFFPDASGFVFQGGARNTCPESVLTSNPSAISMTESGCNNIQEIGLYEHVGRALGGGDYFAVSGEIVSDDGGKYPTTKDPDAAFVFGARTAFTPLLFDGTQFVPRSAVPVDTSFEGDPVLSPSARLVLDRLAGPDDRQLGYVLRSVDATFDGTTYAISAPEIARYCFTGGKPGFSFDERYIAFHHYETNGSANLYLVDLQTGSPVQITHMGVGQYALYPHFRADGWLYAQVRDMTTGHEYTIALDAAL